MPHTYKFYLKRPASDTPLYEDSPEYLNYIETAYISTGKCVSYRQKEFLDEENLIQVYTTIWRSRMDSDSYKTDPVVLENKANMQAHNKAHKIALKQVIDGTIEDSL
jgi:hypothetical protein